jgi:hypothetical protein
MPIYEEKALKYKNYTELSKEASRVLDSETDWKLKNQTAEQNLNSVIKLYDSAKKSREQGDAENAFIFLRRAMDVCMIINKKNNDKSVTFKSAPDVRRFYDLSDTIIGVLSDLTEQLQVRYKLRDEDEIEAQEAEAIKQNSENKASVLKSLPTEYNVDDSAIYIKPKELVDFVEKKKGSALIIDYRTERPKLVDYTRLPHAIFVVHIDPTEIVPGCLFKMLFHVVGVGDRPLLQGISGVDLVVMMGDTNEMKIPFRDLDRRSKTKVLYEVLTTVSLFYITLTNKNW